MSRYIKKFSRVGSIGPNEERGFGLWVGYDIAGTDSDLSDEGFIRVDDWPDDELRKRGVTSFTPTSLEKLGLSPRK
ncbi:MAG TPA: hypothetical protein VL284_11055 [Thermoanaerobaculia bacterium]|nr:hypothetical protein [Thermoanaerobaculia bacterium]